MNKVSFNKIFNFLIITLIPLILLNSTKSHSMLIELTPQISIVPSEIVFETINVGSSSAQMVTISNIGDADLIIDSITLTGQDADEFGVLSDNCIGQAIAQNANCVIQVVFSPTSLGSKTASLSISSNDPDIPIIELPLSTGVFNLHISLEPPEGGTVTGPGIVCPGDCEEPFTTADNITLAANPNTGYTFSGWTGCPEATDNQCIFNMNENRNITASFTLNQYSLTVSKAGIGVGTITSAPAGIECGDDCTDTYGHGTSVTLTATPDEGDVFTGWSGGCTGEGICTVTMIEAKNITAIFENRPIKEVGEGHSYISIQEAINDAVCGEIILVHDGIYFENINFKGKRITVHSKNGAESTIIDGQANGSVITFDHGEAANSILDGFTIQNGSALNGGGIYCFSSAPNITNCIINGNTAGKDGGGIYSSSGSIYSINSSNPKIDNCIISNNIAGEDGGGVFCNIYSEITITDCHINDNVADGNGGGINCASYFFIPISNINDCSITNNTANGVGGGIFCVNSLSNITNCTINNNNTASPEGNGCGIFCYACSPSITNCIVNANIGSGIFCEKNSSPKITGCIINGNKGNDTGGGITLCVSSSPEISNCVISDNKATYSGGIYCSSSSPQINNCTITGNKGNYSGGIYAVTSSSPELTNCILWGDSPTEIYLIDSNSSIQTAYSNIQKSFGIYSGEGNINADPLFVESEKGDYHLMADSPCIDMGTATNAPSKDQAGMSRPQGLEVDMGAYEYTGPSTSCTPLASFVTYQGNCLPVEFDASISGGGRYPGSELLWDFGDGTSGSGLRVVHSYAHEGNYDVRLTIITDCENNSMTSKLLVSPCIPDISATPSFLDFGAIYVGNKSNPGVITITGIGGLTIGSITLTGADASEFLLQNDICSGQTISSSMSHTLQVIFSPTSAGQKNATLTIPSNDPDASTLAISLMGEAIVQTDNPLIWASLDSGTQQNLIGVHFVNPNIGYVVGTYGTILKTTNGGITWAEQSSGVMDHLCSVYFTDVQTGYVVGERGTILKTINGGIEWCRLGGGFTGSNLYSVQFVDSNTGYAVGDNAIILKTIDGGKSWDVKSGEDNSKFYSVYFPEPMIGYAVGHSVTLAVGGIIINFEGIIYKSIDGGETWASIHTVDNKFIMSAYFTDPNTGYLIGYNYYSRNTLVSLYDKWGNLIYYDPNPPSPTTQISTYTTKTANGGNSWTHDFLYSLPDLVLYPLSIYFPDNQTGYMVGEEGRIFHTSNAGDIWVGQTPGEINTLYNLQDVYFPDVLTGYAVGENGTILKASPASPEISSNLADFDFGAISVGSSFFQSVIISNEGNEDLLMDAITIIGPNANEFSLQADNCIGQVIAADGNCVIDAAFFPTSSGLKNASISIASNDPYTPVFELALRGTGEANDVEEIDLENDPKNCGAYGHVCQYDHAIGLCNNGICSLGTCDNGYYNLNNDPNDGCEYECNISNGGVEVCDGLDNDCDGSIDEGVLNTYYFDGDGDGYGIADQSTQACFAPTGYVENAGDCDDNDEQVIEPIPDFICSTTLGYIPLTVQFNNKSIGNVNYSWNFGDSGVSEEKEPKHTYMNAGTYTVTLTVDIGGRCVTKKSDTIHVLGTYTLTGRVLSQDAPVQNAEVQVLGTSQYKIITGEDGVFCLADLPLGSHVLKIIASGYETKFENIVNRPGIQCDIHLNANVGCISGRVFQSGDNKPISANVIAFTYEDGFYTKDTQSDPNYGTYIIYLSRFGDYTLLASADGYLPYIDSNHGNKYVIDPDDPDTFKSDIDITLVPKPQGPKIKVSSFEHDLDPDPNIIDNETMILVSVETNNPLIDPNVTIQVIGGPTLDPNVIIVDDRIMYQSSYSDDIEDIHEIKIKVSAMDLNDTATVPYRFTVNPGTPSSIVGGTSDDITFIEGGETGQVGLVNLDLDGDEEYDYDGSYINIPPCGVVSISGEDPNFALTTLTIRIERMTEEETGTITAQYDVYLLNQDGNPATGFVVNEDRPLTIYLHFDPDRFDGNLANLVIKYQCADGFWKTDGIQNIRVEGTTIAFDVTHLTRFAAFIENIAPTNLTVKAATISQIDLSWVDCSQNEFYFEIWRCVNCNNTEDINNYIMFTDDIDPNVTVYSDKNLIKDYTYYYAVRAINEFGATDFSHKSGLTLNECVFVPGAPINLTSIANSSSQITLNWQIDDPNNSCITNFKIFRSLNNETWREIGDTDPNTLVYLNTGLQPETTYYYRVKATNITGDSDPSNIAQATTLKEPAPDTGGGGSCFISAITGILF